MEKQNRQVPIERILEGQETDGSSSESIKQLHKHYSFRRVYVDETGMGDTLLDLIREVDDTINVYGVNFKGDKTEIYVNLERLFEERIINLSLLEEFHREKLSDQLSYMYWDHGKYKDQQPKVRSDHSDDYSDSLALVAKGQEKVDFMQDLDGLWESTGEYIGW